MRTEIITVTPELAKQYLAQNFNNNRKIRPSRVQFFAKIIRDGHWRTTHQGIAFDTRKRLIDGQHRLMAIIVAGIAVRIQVTHDLPPESVDALDTGCGRTMADILVTRGQTASTRSAAIAKRLVSGMFYRSDPDNYEAMEYHERYRDAIDFTLSLFPTNIKYITITPVLTVVTRAYISGSESTGRLREFANVLKTGEPQSPEDQAAIVLRNFLLTTTRTHIREARAHNVVLTQKTERALYAFFAGERMMKLTSASEELFPLPEELTAQAETHAQSDASVVRGIAPTGSNGPANYVS